VSLARASVPAATVARTNVPWATAPRAARSPLTLALRWQLLLWWPFRSEAFTWRLSGWRHRDADQRSKTTVTQDVPPLPMKT